MLDPIIDFFVRVFNMIGRGIGWFIALLLWPFVWFSVWYKKRGWLLKSGIGLIVLRGRDRNIPIPFGPYLAIAGWIALLWGDELTRQYLLALG